MAADLKGYNWGSATDVKGQANVNVETDKESQLIVRKSKLVVGFVFADGSVCEDEYVKIYTQELNISDQWVASSLIASGYTDNSGMIEFSLTAGNYIVEADFKGYNWGNAVDMEGQSNIPLHPGHTNQLVAYLGRLSVVAKDSEGNPKDDEYVTVYFQQEDINGNPTVGNNVANAYTSNTGKVEFDLVPGIYAIRIGDSYYYNIEVKAKTITTADGNNIVFNP